MDKNYFLTSLFLMFPFFLQAQEIRLSSSSTTNMEWESIINDFQNIKGDTVAAKVFLKPLKDRNSKNDQFVYNVLLASAYAKNFDGINTKSDNLYSHSIRKGEKIKNDYLEIWAILSYGDYLYKFRQMTKALPIYILGIDKIEEVDPKQMLFAAESFTKIGFYMGTIGDNLEAIKYLKKANEYAKSGTSEAAKIKDNLGFYYFKIGDLGNAEQCFKEASQISKSIGDEIRYAKTLGNLALIHERNGEFTEAIKLLLEDIKISEQYKSEQNTMFAYTELTRLLIANNQIKEAKESAKKADEIAKSRSYFKINELEILKLKLNILNIEQKEDEELEVRRRIGVLEDSLNKTEGILPLNQANWMLQKRKYQQNIEDTKKQLSAASFLKNLIFAISGILILFVFLMFINSKKREKKKKIQTERKIIEYENAKLRNEQKLLDATRTLDAQIDFLKEKNIQIQKLHSEIQTIKESKSSTTEKDHGKLDEILKSHLMTEENWLSFKREFKKEHSVFYNTLQESFPEITDSNLRIILLQKLGFSNSEISGLLGITVDAVKKSKQRLKHKLGEKYDLLFNMIVSEN